MLVIATPLQLLSGDMHGLNTLEEQPVKVAAMEGNWETQGNVPLLLFALPDEAARTNHLALEIPNGASLILAHAADGEVPGLDDFVRADGTVLHPPVAPVFWAFRIMVGTGLAMLALAWLGAWGLARHGLEGLDDWVARGFVAMTFSGWIATLAGWYATEIGRQPWLVTGVLGTSEAAAPHGAPLVATTLALYIATYVVLTLSYVSVIFYLARRAATGDVGTEELEPRPLGGLESPEEAFA
jgi:cytochrome d ubiquinol oxidase subunit I